MAEGPNTEIIPPPPPPDLAGQAKTDTRIKNRSIKEAGETGIGVMMKGKDLLGNKKPQIPDSEINQESQTPQEPVTRKELLEQQATLEAERKRKGDEINQSVKDFVNRGKNTSDTNKP